jgi:hypothetical protein
MSEQSHSPESRTSKSAKASDARHAAGHEQTPQGVASFMPPPEDAGGKPFGEVKNDDLVAKAATIAVIGVGVALISTELIPGMLIGVAAALLPGIGPKMRPLLKSTVKAGFGAVRKTREMIAEAGEQVQDMIAEAQAEDVAPVPPPSKAAKLHA